MKRGGFLGAIAGALAAAALPIPLSAKRFATFEPVVGPGLMKALPERLAYSEAVTQDCLTWASLNEAFILLQTRLDERGVPVLAVS